MTGAPGAHKAPHFLVVMVVFLAGSFFVSACEPINGAAVEVSWVVHTPGGYAIRDCSCADPVISQIRLQLTPQEAGGVPLTYAFACGRQRGATPFEVPAGTYELGVVALDSAGQPAAGIDTPPPFVRKLVWGQAASMDAQNVEAPCAPRCANKNGTCSAQ